MACSLALGAISVARHPERQFITSWLNRLSFYVAIVGGVVQAMWQSLLKPPHIRSSIRAMCGSCRATFFGGCRALRCYIAIG